MPKHLVNAAAAVLLALWAVSAWAGSMTLLGVGKTTAAGGTNFLLADTGSALLVDTGSKFLVQ